MYLCAEFKLPVVGVQLYTPRLWDCFSSTSLSEFSHCRAGASLGSSLERDQVSLEAAVQADRLYFQRRLAYVLADGGQELASSGLGPVSGWCLK